MTTVAQEQLYRTEGRINALQMHMRELCNRYAVLNGLPGGRSDMSSEERIEYDLVRGLFSNVLHNIGKAINDIS